MILNDWIWANSGGQETCNWEQDTWLPKQFLRSFLPLKWAPATQNGMGTCDIRFWIKVGTSRVLHLPGLRRGRVLGWVVQVLWCPGWKFWSLDSLGSLHPLVAVPCHMFKEGKSHNHHVAISGVCDDAAAELLILKPWEWLALAW